MVGVLQRARKAAGAWIVESVVAAAAATVSRAVMRRRVRADVAPDGLDTTVTRVSSLSKLYLPRSV